jgi:UDP-N-acetyl-D-mannosaminuronate dehydrogenase
LGLAYKRDIDDVRESPALDVMRLLEQEGAEVKFFDPYVSQIIWNSRNKSGLNSIENIADFDVTVILTDHSNVDYEFVRKNSGLVIDTRNVYPTIKDKNIVRLGVGEIK